MSTRRCAGAAGNHEQRAHKLQIQFLGRDADPNREVLRHRARAPDAPRKRSLIAKERLAHAVAWTFILAYASSRGSEAAHTAAGGRGRRACLSGRQAHGGTCLPGFVQFVPSGPTPNNMPQKCAQCFNIVGNKRLLEAAAPSRYPRLTMRMVLHGSLDDDG